MDWFRRKPTPSEEEVEIFEKLYERFIINKEQPRYIISIKGSFKNKEANKPDFDKFLMLKNKFINNPDFPQYKEKIGGKTRKRKMKRRRTVSR